MALFPTFTAAAELGRSRRGGRAYLQLPALPPACVWEPARHKFPASEGRIMAGPTGRLSRHAPARPGRIPPAAGVQSGSCRDFPSLPPGRAQASPSLPARPAAGRQQPPGLRKLPAVSKWWRVGRWGRGGDSGQNLFVRWPPHRHALAGLEENKRGMSASKRQEMKQHGGQRDLLGLGWGFSLLTYCFIIKKKKRERKK